MLGIPWVRVERLTFGVGAGAVLLALGGCATQQPEPLRPSFTRRAQVVAQNPGGRIRFDGIFARDSQGAAALDLYKGGVAPVAALRIAPEGSASFHLRAEGRSWRGSREKAPASILPLLEILALFAREQSLEDGQREIRLPTHRAIVEVSQGQIRSVAVLSDSGHAALAVFPQGR